MEYIKTESIANQVSDDASKERCKGMLGTVYNDDGWPRDADYVDAEMRDINDLFGLKQYPKIWDIIEKYKKEKDRYGEPTYSVKYAGLYFTYQGKAYHIGPSFYDCSDEIFAKMARRMIKDLWDAGCYKMIETSMLD